MPLRTVFIYTNEYGTESRATVIYTPDLPADEAIIEDIEHIAGYPALPDHITTSMHDLIDPNDHQPEVHHSAEPKPLLRPLKAYTYESAQAYLDGVREANDNDGPLHPLTEDELKGLEEFFNEDDDITRALALIDNAFCEAINNILNHRK